MKLIQAVIALNVVMGSTVGFAQKGEVNPQLIEYHLCKNRYAVVVMLDGVTVKEAYRIARKKAAEICSENGYCSYRIVSESKGAACLDYAFHKDETNLYQEVIVEQEFGRERILDSQDRRKNRGCEMAVRVVFVCSHRK